MPILLEPFTFAVALHGLMVVSVGLRVVMVRPLPGVALAWLLLVATLPLLGTLSYLAFGE